MPNLAPDIAAQLGTALLIAVEQRVTLEQCRHIAYLMTIGYGRTESLDEIQDFLQLLNQDAADLITHATLNTANMSIENMILSDDEKLSNFPDGSDEYATENSDDVPLKQKRKASASQYRSARKRRRIIHTTSGSETSEDELLPLSQRDREIQRQPGLTVEIPPLSSDFRPARADEEMAIYELSSTPVRSRCISTELGSEYIPPESAQKEVVSSEDQTSTTSPHTISHNGPFTTKSLINEERQVLDNALKDVILNDTNCDGLPRRLAACPLRTSSGLQQEDANKNEFQREDGAAKKLQPSSVDRDRTTWAAPKKKTKRMSGSQDDPVYIKSESEFEQVDAAVEKAKAKKLAKREKRKRKEERENKQWTDITATADLAQTQPESAFSLSSQTLGQIHSGTPIDTLTDYESSSWIPTTRRKKKPKVKREKSTNPQKSSPRQERKKEWLARQQESEKQKGFYEEQHQLPTPPGSTPSNTTQLPHLVMRRLAQKLPSRPRPCQDSIANLGQQSHVEAALNRDKQVRASAPAPSFMIRQTGFTEGITGCGDDVLDFTVDDDLILDVHAELIPESLLTFRTRDPNASQQAVSLKAAGRGKQETTNLQRDQHHQHQLHQSLQHHGPLDLTGPFSRANASGTNASSQMKLPAPCSQPRLSAQYESTPLFRPRQPNNVLEPVSNPQPSFPIFTQRMITMRERVSLPNPGRRPWLPLPTIRKQTPAAWHKLGQSSSANPRKGVSKPKIILPASTVDRFPFKLDTDAFQAWNHSACLPQLPSHQLSQNHTESHASSSRWRDPSWPAHSRSPSGESSYLLWGSIRMRTTWDDDESTFLDNYSESEVSDGLEIVDVPRPRRWCIAGRDHTSARVGGEGKAPL